MEKILLNQIGPIFVGIIIALLGATIKIIGNELINYINKKQINIDKEIEINKHRKEFMIAKEIWHIVDENFRINSKIDNYTDSKSKEFDKLLLKKIPYLSQSEINYIRQAIAGEINQGKKSIIIDDTNINTK